MCVVCFFFNIFPDSLSPECRSTRTLNRATLCLRANQLPGDSDPWSFLAFKPVCTAAANLDVFSLPPPILCSKSSVFLSSSKRVSEQIMASSLPESQWNETMLGASAKMATYKLTESLTYLPRVNYPGVSLHSAQRRRFLSPHTMPV